MIYAEDLATGIKYLKYTSCVSDLRLYRNDYSKVLNQDIHFSIQNGERNKKHVKIHCLSINLTNCLSCFKNRYNDFVGFLLLFAYNFLFTSEIENNNNNLVTVDRNDLINELMSLNSDKKDANQHYKNKECPKAVNVCRNNIRMYIIILCTFNANVWH